jgi:hypothetical protein
MGGWIFHTLVDFSKSTPFVQIKSGAPTSMKEWTSKVEGK